MKKAVRDLVLGMKELPEKGGYWGASTQQEGGARRSGAGFGKRISVCK